MLLAVIMFLTTTHLLRRESHRNIDLTKSLSMSSCLFVTILCEEMRSTQGIYTKY